MLQSRRKKILDLYARACNVTEGESVRKSSIIQYYCRPHNQELIWQYCAGVFGFFWWPGTLFINCVEVRN